MAIPRPLRQLVRRWIAAAFVLGCASCSPGDGSIVATPGSLITTPSQPEAAVELHNTSDTPAPLSGVRLAGEDWDGFVILDETIPSEIPANSSLQLRVRASTKAFRKSDAEGDFLGYTEANARLDYRDGDARESVALEFIDPSGWQTRFLPSVLATFVFALAAWMLLVLRRRRVSDAATAATPSVAVIATSLLALALIPFGDAVCPSGLGLPSSSAALAQCREGLGGAPLSALSLPTSLLVWIAVMALGPLAASSATRERDLSGRLERNTMFVARMLVATLVLTALVASAGSLDLHELALAQAERFASAPLPRWGALTQPLGFALLLGCAALERVSAPDESGASVAAPDVTVRRHAWSALAAALYLGAWQIPNWPGHGVAAHGVLLVVGAAAFAIKWAVVHKVISAIARSQRFALAAARGVEVRTLVRWFVPLALLNLFGSLLVG